jgi:hypothetical protein
VLYKLLFDAACRTLLEFGEGRFKARIGVTAVLHTWSQTLLDHYHVHCIVTGGGVALDETRWIKSSPNYLFPVKALSRMFRGKYLAGLQAHFKAGELKFHGKLIPLANPGAFAALVRQATAPEWVVYAKRPFAGPGQVLAYLSRYTHRVAISNRRLISGDGQSVTFDYKDYADEAKHKTMTLDTAEFIRRFCLHVLPERFVKIRHYGLLGNRKRDERLSRARLLLGTPEPVLSEAPTGPSSDIHAPRPCCPFCRKPALILLRDVAPARPRHIKIADSS